MEEYDLLIDRRGNKCVVVVVVVVVVMVEWVTIDESFAPLMK